MIYIKAIFVAACVALAIVFMVQNMTELSEPLRIRLNLLFVQFESTPFATYLVILLAFFVGLLAASLLGIAERFKLRKLIRKSRKEVDSLSKELNSLRNLPITGAPVGKKPGPGASAMKDPVPPVKEPVKPVMEAGALKAEEPVAEDKPKAKSRIGLNPFGRKPAEPEKTPEDKKEETKPGEKEAQP